MYLTWKLVSGLYLYKSYKHKKLTSSFMFVFQWYYTNKKNWH